MAQRSNQPAEEVMEGRSQEQAVKDTITGLTGAVMALAGEVCQRDPALARSLAATLAGLLDKLPDDKKRSPQATVLGMMRTVAEDALVL